MYSLIMVDDEIWTLRDMEVLLQAVEGFRLAGAYTNPLEAEAAIRHSPPDVVLTDLRMDEARAMLEEKRPIKEVIGRVGYSDVYQFSRAYKRHFGFPPSKTE